MRNKVLSKERLIEVAEDIIKEEGLEACSSRNIAKHANCALGTIYNYFESRDVFLQEVFIKSWDNTKKRLSEILKLDIPSNLKASKMFHVIDEDIQNRRGIGKYLFETVFKDNNKECMFDILKDGILDIFVSLLKESDKNKNLNDATLQVVAEWIYYGAIVLRKNGSDTKTFYKIAIDRFF
jgi:AcrR family transcriptional regulator